MFSGNGAMETGAGGRPLIKISFSLAFKSIFISKPYIIKYGGGSQRSVPGGSASIHSCTKQLGRAEPDVTGKMIKCWVRIARSAIFLKAAESKNSIA